MNTRLRKHLLLDALLSFVTVAAFISAVIICLCRLFVPFSYSSMTIEILTLIIAFLFGILISRKYYMKFDIWMHKHIYKSGV
jgi:hypothetical protein